MFVQDIATQQQHRDDAIISWTDLDKYEGDDTRLVCCGVKLSPGRRDKGEGERITNFDSKLDQCDSAAACCHANREITICLNGSEVIWQVLGTDGAPYQWVALQGCSKLLGSCWFTVRNAAHISPVRVLRRHLAKQFLYATDFIFQRNLPFSGSEHKLEQPDSNSPRHLKVSAHTQKSKHAGSTFYTGFPNNEHQKRLHVQTRSSSQISSTWPLLFLFALFCRVFFHYFFSCTKKCSVRAISESLFSCSPARSSPFMCENPTLTDYPWLIIAPRFPPSNSTFQRKCKHQKRNKKGKKKRNNTTRAFHVLPGQQENEGEG